MKIKTCVTCKWFIDNTIITGLAKCISPKFAPLPNLVTGEVVLEFCQLLRLDKNQCGPDGVWWESKELEHIIINETVSPNIPRKKTFIGILNDWLNGNL
jgi:hypothetical protein